MALATRCPSCSTVFRISTAQAAAKGGMVRCGLCAGVFNSLDALVRVEDLDVIDEVDVSQVRAAPGPDASPSVAPADDGSPAVEPDALPADVRAEAAAAPVDDLAPEAAGGAVPAWWLPASPAVDEATAAEQPVEAPAAAAGLDEPTATTSTGRRTDPASPLESTHPTFMRPDPATTDEGRAARWIYGLLSAVAAVGLLVQCAYLWRDEVAARVPPARPLLRAMCVPLRCVVGDPAHLDAITIESASVQASGPNLDVYVLTALLRNREPIDVRYPHLELVLTDLQDRPILRRALRPEDYVPAAASGGGRAPGGFPAGSELPIRVVFELNGLRFVGYRLDRFYP